MKKNIGIEAKKPEKKCEDGKCPWHGTLSVRGRVFTGKVISDRAHRTAVVEWGYYKYFPKYKLFERRSTRVNAYNPQCIDARAGDTVRISECRPLSKTKSFVVIEKLLEKVSSKK